MIIVIMIDKKTKSTLDRKLKEIRETPASFTFFVSLHDFVEYVESNPSFAVFFSGSKKGSRSKEISLRYAILKQVYQGIEDLDVQTNADLGHDRNVAIRDLSLIRSNNVSENNSFWKRRELLRKIAAETHATLDSYLAE